MMRNFSFRSFISGMVVMVLLSATILPAFGATTKNIQVLYGGIKIYINDSLFTPKDGNGNIVEPLVYNGRTYLPVRAISEALGEPVAWEGKTSSVYIGNHSSTVPSATSANLMDMNYFYREGEQGPRWDVNWDSIRKVYTTGIKDNVGNMYYDGFAFTNWCSSGFYVYNIDQKYKAFKGIIALTEADKDTSYLLMVKIYGDNKLLYTSPRMTKGSYPVKFDVNVTGVNQLKIEKVSDNHRSTGILSGLDLYK